MRPATPMILAAALLLAGCSRKHAASGDQIVAVVDGEELTAPILETALAALPDGVDPHSAVVQRAVVGQLVDEMLLSAAARKQGLENKPQTSRDLARAERVVLSVAYLRRIENLPQPSDQAVVSYYSDHPYFFAERRRYHLTKITVTGSPRDVQPYLTAAKQGGGSLDAVKAALAAKGVQNVPEGIIADADAFGPDLGAKLSRLAVGDTFNFRTGATQTFARIDGVDQSPVPLALARPVIARMLETQAQQVSARQSIDRLRQRAKIEYGPVGKKVLMPTT